MRSITALLLAFTLTAAAGPTHGAGNHPSAAERDLLLASTAVHDAAQRLLARALQPAADEDLLPALEALAADRTLPAAERDAVLLRFIDLLRTRPPGTVSTRVLDWLSSRPAAALTGHEEGPHHAVALFNVRAAALGLRNQWQWQTGYRASADRDGPAPAQLLSTASAADVAWLRGARAGLREAAPARLDALHRTCTATPGTDGCAALHPDVQLARRDIEWLEAWLRTAAPASATPRLRQARERWPSEAADRLMQGALEHPAPEVAAWALSDLTAHLPADGAVREDWGRQLIALLDDPQLGGAAALQLVRMPSGDWLERAAAAQPSEAARKRLELMARLESGSAEAGPDADAKR
jgi:hypothetical protein